MTWKTALLLAVAVSPLAPGAPAAAQTPVSRLERAADALEISNIMGRYSIYIVANQWAEIGDMFALDEPDVRQNVPAFMEGPAVRKYFATRDAQEIRDGEMHQHSFLAPVIEVAGDGQTAKGVWDSPGIDVGAGDRMANWAWVRYAIDFKKVKGEWKIWHMKVLPVWRAPYGPAWSEMVKQASGGKMSGGGAPPAGAASTAPAPRPAAMAGLPPAGAAGTGQAPEQRWRYSGLGAPPMLPINPPKPYYTFDPKDAY